jgi:hypothetical protein
LFVQYYSSFPSLNTTCLGFIQAPYTEDEKLMKEPSDNRNQAEDPLYFGGHIVAFIDILGQSSSLANLNKIDWWKFDHKTIKALKETYGIVMRFRELFDDYLTTFSNSTAIDEIHMETASKTEQLEIWNQYANTKIMIKYISDSVMMTFPLIITNGLFPLKGIYNALVACSSSMIASLNYKFAIRGAIEIGPCIFDFRSTEVYGSALNDAIRYEKVADWPRIIIGPRLVGYLEYCTELLQDSIANKINSATARQCLTIIAKDDSGNYFLDYLASDFSELWDLCNAHQIIEGALLFIDEQIKKFQNDDKIRSKYNNLRDYFKLRIGMRHA